VRLSRIEEDGVVGRLRVDRVALVALSQIGGEVIRGDAGSVGRPPARALVGVGEQEHLHLGLRCDDRANVATFDHGVAADREGALSVTHHVAHLGMTCDRRHQTVDLSSSDRRRHVLPVDLHEATFPERDRMRERDLREQRSVGDVRSVAACNPGQRSVHRPGVEVAESQPAREPRRDGALSRAGRPVDGHDHVAGG
jgi:hypothetical protein